MTVSSKSTTFEFIEKSRNIHGDLYDYSKVVYVNSKTKVSIVCKKHGEFLQIPESHLQKKGCKKCGIDTLKKLPEHYNTIIKEIHGDDILNFDGSYAVCNRGHKFKTTINKLVSKKTGCTRCKKIKIIQKMIDDICAYSGIKVNTIPELKTNIIDITCEKHGISSSTVHQLHSASHPCRLCRKDTEIITNFEKYNINVPFTVQLDIITFLCKKHNSKTVYNFSDTISYTKSMGCKECLGEIKQDLSARQTITQEDYIKRANEVHNYKYKYSDVKYEGMHSKIKITCSRHGDFEQHAASHLQGSGCPSCTKIYSKMENNWLDSLGIRIQKQKRIDLTDGKYVISDGYDPFTNTVYEFWGDFWHGNPAIYDPNDINPVTKTTFGELYNKTVEKLNIYRQAGYNTECIWESQWTNEQIKEYKNENQKDKN